MIVLYVLAIFMSASLLFLIQPMIAKMVLPRLGGSPSVWNTCMAFYQAVLLAGYAYVHLLTRKLAPSAQVAVHALVLAIPVIVLPLSLRVIRTTAESPPIVFLLAILAASVALPFFALSATGPLIQRWFSTTDHPHAADPYFLYAASNVGSLAGLLGYPLLMEPFLKLQSKVLSLSQSTLWSAGYIVLAVLVLICGIVMLRQRVRHIGVDPAVHQAEEKGTLRSRLLWIFLAFIPASLTIGATQHLTTDIMAVPLLWVAPLALYLLTMSMAFSRRTWIPLPWSSTALAFLAVAITLMIWVHFHVPLLFILLLDLLTVFAAGLVCHCSLAASRPAPSRLTEFYLLIAFGGALGGAFNAFVAPVIFNSIREYHLVLLLACFVRPAYFGSIEIFRKRRDFLHFLMPAASIVAWILIMGVLSRIFPGIFARPSMLMAYLGPLALVVLFSIKKPKRFAMALAVLLAIAFIQPQAGWTTLHKERTFFGVHEVKLGKGEPFDAINQKTGNMEVIQFPLHKLFHGTTVHGIQIQTDGLREKATAYYHSTSTIGQIFEYRSSHRDPTPVAVVGLGAGTLASYGEPGGRITFYEIDPEVVRIASNPEFFTYIRDSKAQVDFVPGDARLTLADVPDSTYGLIVLDAFSSDAVPVHLLTREAMQLYFRKLRPDGLIAVHISSRYVSLQPVLNALAADLGIAGLAPPDDEVRTLAEKVEGKTLSTWVVLARNPSVLNDLPFAGVSVPLPFRASFSRRYLWTDDFSYLLGVLKLR